MLLIEIVFKISYSAVQINLNIYNLRRLFAYFQRTEFDHVDEHQRYISSIGHIISRRLWLRQRRDYLTEWLFI